MTNFKSDRKKPCKECPFSRNNNLTGDKPGGAYPAVYIGQSEGPFWLPCHMEKEYDGKQTDPSKVNQCAGAAIYRANVGVASKMPKQILTLPENKEDVFASHAEFLSHYSDIPFNVAVDILNEETLSELLKIELEKNVKMLQSKP